MAGDAKIRINLREGAFEVEGSEQFVKAQLKAYDKEIRESLANAPAAPPPAPAGGGNGDGGGSGRAGDIGGGNTAQAQLRELANVLEVVGDRVRILKRAPGSGKRPKMRNVSLLYLLGAELGGRTEMVPTAELRQACEDNGCLDSTNFAAALRAEHGNIVVEDNAARLTVPGREKAKELAESLKQS